MIDVFKRALHIELDNYTSAYKDCLKQAVQELIPEKELANTCLIYDININEYIDQLYKDYLKFKYELLTGYYKNEPKKI